MYCTLQEAYNVPSFDPPSRKKRCAPDAQAKASADAYEPYRRDGGNGTGDFTMYKYAQPKPVQEPIQGNKPLQRRIPYEPFQNRGEREHDSSGKIPYRAKQGDRDQYCKAYGICSADQMEAFTNQEADEGKCKSSPDFYEVPLSEETKKQFSAAMETSLNENSSSTKSYVPKMRYDNMNNVSGYYDEDLEQYLKNSEASNVPKRFPMNPEAKPSDAVHSPTNSPLSQTLKRFSEHSVQQPLQPERLASSDTYERKVYSYMPDGASGGAGSYGWDLAMFILAGVLIIFLIDQLFKMGVMLGMRHTMEIMSPFMKEFEAMIKK